MPHLPPIPDWASLHPAIIHFPIVLLLMSPIWILISVLLTPARGRAYLYAGLVLLLAGTASLFVAVETGDAAAELAERTATVDSVLHEHQNLASETMIVFSALTVLLLLLCFLPRALRWQPTRFQFASLTLVFLALYATGALSLVNTAHQGARLVHQFGVHAVIPGDTSHQQTSREAEPE
ncbi:hypothetical protein DYQ86_09725 [Acidobacteria bacterium AB60]|nr:hypothetical protein DYQ86_09725 [Acidobacteria bacterium AB60]